MLSYISVNVPPLKLDANDGGWSLAERATWLLMTASTSGLIQVLNRIYSVRLVKVDFKVDNTYSILNAVISLEA